MPDRKATAIWHGDLPNGNGKFGTDSGAVKDAAYSFKTRFENEPGTNPEEMLAAAHAACYSMAFANQLSKRGHKVDHIETVATCVLTKGESGFSITKMILNARGKVEGIDQAAFQQLAEETDKQYCPVSKALGAVEHEVHATLV
jgi:lipoyl-dependent peroxiredoxin